MARSLIPRGSGLPQINIYQDCETPIPENQFKQFSEAIDQINNAERLRNQLIGLQQLRADNAIGLSVLEGKYLDLDVENQRNQTKKVKFSEELQRTNLALMRVDGLTIQTAIEGVKNSTLSLNLNIEQQRLEQSKRRHQLELQAADIELKQLEIDTNAAKQLAGQKTKQTIDIPARRVA